MELLPRNCCWVLWIQAKTHFTKNTSSIPKSSEVVGITNRAEFSTG